MNKTLATLIALVSLGAAPVFALPFASLTVLDDDITVGENFEVEVWVDGDSIGEGLVAFGFDVNNYSSSLYSYDSYQVGTDFFDFSDPSNANNVSGGYADIEPPSTDNILLATLSLTALANGTGSLDVEGLFDGFFYGLYYEGLDSNYDVSSETQIVIAAQSVPEPATVLLLGMGFAGLVASKRRKSSN